MSSELKKNVKGRNESTKTLSALQRKTLCHKYYHLIYDKSEMNVVLGEKIKMMTKSRDVALERWFSS